MRTSLNKFERTDIWREGQWLDLWSVVHFLSGILVGFGLYLCHFGGIASFLVALLLLTLYEMWEALVKIEETLSNRFMDVVVGMASFVPTFYLLAPRLSMPLFVLVCIGVGALDLTMSTFGWRASQKAAELQHKMHTKFEQERSRLHKQKARLRKRFRR